MTEITQKVRWTVDQIESLFIHLSDQKPCLWDIADKLHQKRDINEKALSEISKARYVDTNNIKHKWNSYRAPYGKEISKQNKTKVVKALTNCTRVNGNFLISTFYWIGTINITIKIKAVLSILMIPIEMSITKKC